MSDDMASRYQMMEELGSECRDSVARMYAVC